MAAPPVAFVFSSLFHCANMLIRILTKRDLAMKPRSRHANERVPLLHAFWELITGHSGADEDLTCPTMAEHGRVRLAAVSVVGSTLTVLVRCSPSNCCLRQ